MDWTTPNDVLNQLARNWSSGRMLAAPLKGETMFPLTLAFRRPTTAELAHRFDEVRTWIRELESASCDRTGVGYRMEWMVRNHRELGPNRIPIRLVVPTESDALQLLGKSAEAECFHRLATRSLEVFPSLKPWLARQPLVALQHADDWERILAVLAWFCSNPASGLYLRQVEIAGVDTKFVEDRKGLFTELMNAVRNSENSGTFEQRFGLRPKPPLIRFRLLDERLYIRGLSDLAVPAADFARLAPDARTVVIAENEINGLAFPNHPASLVIFGLGYGLDRLSQAAWLRDRSLYYWGDIDTHGFAMLHRLRSIFPHAKSFLMDRETLLLHRSSWVRDSEPYDGPLDGLTTDERKLFDDLRYDTFGQRIRLEQERISFKWIKLALQRDFET